MILPLGLSALGQYHLPSGFINHDIAQKEVFYSVNIESDYNYKNRAATILRLLGNKTIQFNTQVKKSEPVFENN